MEEDDGFGERSLCPNGLQYPIAQEETKFETKGDGREFLYQGVHKVVCEE